MTEKLKICMIGATAVGKTSLVSRYVSSIFHERYATTIGVKIESREVQYAGSTVKLILWDLSGEDEFQSVQLSYLRGAAGCVVVVDGTRRGTLDTAMSLEARARAITGEIPFVVALNKVDRTADWELSRRDLEALQQRHWVLVRTSARTGDGVEEAFRRLVAGIHERQGATWT